MSITAFFADLFKQVAETKASKPPIRIGPGRRTHARHHKGRTLVKVGEKFTANSGGTADGFGWTFNHALRKWVRGYRSGGKMHPVYAYVGDKPRKYVPDTIYTRGIA